MKKMVSARLELATFFFKIVTASQPSNKNMRKWISPGSRSLDCQSMFGKADVITTTLRNRIHY